MHVSFVPAEDLFNLCTPTAAAQQPNSTYLRLGFIVWTLFEKTECSSSLQVLSGSQRLSKADHYASKERPASLKALPKIPTTAIFQFVRSRKTIVNWSLFEYDALDLSQSRCPLISFWRRQAIPLSQIFRIFLGSPHEQKKRQWMINLDVVILISTSVPTTSCTRFVVTTTSKHGYTHATESAVDLMTYVCTLPDE